MPCNDPQLARLSHNMENATVETPSDINEEVRRILGGLKHNRAVSPEQQLYQYHQHQPQQQPQQQPQLAPQSPQQHRPRSPRKAPKPAPASAGAAARPSEPQSASSPGAKFPGARRPRSGSPVLVPEVMLLDEQRRSPVGDKPIGFRPPWMCQV